VGGAVASGVSGELAVGSDGRPRLSAAKGGSDGAMTKKLSAVAVSKGPGSYTGLRIGVSFAKGLCYGLGIPLIGVGSLESLCEVARMGLNVEPGLGAGEVAVSDLRCKSGGELFVPMIDARRMEVYGQVFDAQGRALTEPEAWIVDEDSLGEWRGADCWSGASDGCADRGGGREKEVYIFGSGAEKCREVLPWARFLDVKPSASGMVRLAAEAFAAGRFEDTAYFEPLYLKDFVVTTSTKKLF
jgi:tRNA threonylcarbamoyladenosine biosynthesis protein TsaB